MVLNYEFVAGFSGHSDKLDEDFYDYDDFEIEIDINDEIKVAIELVMNDIGCDRKTAEKFVDYILLDYDFFDDYLEKNEDFVKEYFEELAYEEYRNR